MLSKERLHTTSAYHLRNGEYHLSVIRTYESGKALYDIITFEDGDVIYAKNTRDIANPSPEDMKFYDFIKDAHLPEPRGMWEQNIPHTVKPTTKTTYSVDNRPIGSRSNPSVGTGLGGTR